MTPRYREQLFHVSYAQTLIAVSLRSFNTAKILYKSLESDQVEIIFNIHQAIEKALKSVLCYEGVPVPLVHNIGTLTGSMPRHLNPPGGHDLDRYNDYAGLLRYETGNQVLSKEDMDAAFNMAQKVIDWAQLTIGIKK